MRLDHLRQTNETEGREEIGTLERHSRRRSSGSEDTLVAWRFSVGILSEIRMR